MFLQAAIEKNHELERASKEERSFVMQVMYWRSHLDRFIVDYLGVPLVDVQQYVARGVSVATHCYVIQNRSYGKTWEMGAIALAIGILYPGSSIAIVSATMEQANLVLCKIRDELLDFPAIARECENISPKFNTKTSNRFWLKNKSVLVSGSMNKGGEGLRGLRFKVVIVDESRLVPADDLMGTVNPTLKHNRPICARVKDLIDYDSKIIHISSAYLKSCDFYASCKHAYREMVRGNTDYFICAFDWLSCIRTGIRKEKDFEEDRKTMPEAVFAMEYGSIFIGNDDKSIFPYSLTDPCRTLRSVELRQPKHGQSRYIIAADLATSSGKLGDNACVSVLKLVEHTNGEPWEKELVWIRTYHGKNLEELRDEIRGVQLLFPGTVKIVIDVNGLGEGMVQMMDKVWKPDGRPDTEYPPLIVDGARSTHPEALPLIYPFKATNALNNSMATIMVYNLEQHLLKLPIHSASYDIKSVEVGDDMTKRDAQLSMVSVLKDADALQVEMGNIVSLVAPGGSVTYNVSRQGLHKDRYSSVAMGLWYAALLEEEEKASFASDTMCWGVVRDL